MKNILIIGFGEVGSSVYHLYDDYKNKYNVFTYDLNKETPNDPTYEFAEKDVKFDVMHITIPSLKEFISITSSYIKSYNPELTIIHSTVPMYTTQEIHKKTGADIVHSPVMGIHPHLTKSIQTFEKIIGGTTKKSTELATEHFLSIGVTPIVYRDSDHSEIAKMLSTTYYAWNIAFMQNVHELCELYNLDFDEIYTATNHVYNDGYKRLGKDEVIRPVLKYMGKGIGGHCLVENAIMLDEDGMLPEIVKPILSVGKDSQPDYANFVWMYTEIVGKGRTVEEIAMQCGVHVDLVDAWRKTYGLPDIEKEVYKGAI